MRCNSGDSGRSVLGRVRLPFGRPGLRRSAGGGGVRVQERGFVRVKLIDVPFVVPVQIDAYEEMPNALPA